MGKLKQAPILRKQCLETSFSKLEINSNLQMDINIADI